MTGDGRHPRSREDQPASAAAAGLGVRGRVGLVLGPALAAGLLLLPAPEGLDLAAWRTAAVGALMATWWVTEAVPIPVTSLVPLVAFPLLGILPIDAAAAPYANPVIYLFLGGFVIALAVRRRGLHERMALSIVRWVGTRPSRLVLGFLLATAFVSMWVSNTATAAMMLPIAAAVVLMAERQDPPRRDLAAPLMLAVAYGANLGGVATLIGTPPNALLAGFLAESHGIEIGFARWMLFGVPLVAVSLPLCWLLLLRLHPLAGGELAGGRAYVRDRLAALGRLSGPERVVGGITAAVAAAWIVRPWLERFVPGLSDAGIAVAGAVALFVAPVSVRPWRPAIGWEDVAELPWSVLLLFGGGLSLAAAIADTGLAGWLGASLGFVERWPLALVVLTVTAAIVFLTELTSNTATAAAFLPIAAALAVGAGADPRSLAVPTAVAASCAFMMPVATPPNAIVYGSGRISVPQMIRAGLWVNLLMIGLIEIAVLWLAPAVLSGSAPR